MKKPAEKSPLAESRPSLGFSTEMDMRSGSVSVAANEVEANRRKTNTWVSIAI